MATEVGLVHTMKPPPVFNELISLTAQTKTKAVNKRPLTTEALEIEERHRRDLWHFQFGFEGVNATDAEREAENLRRQKYRDSLLLLQTPPSNSRPSNSGPDLRLNIPRIPSIPSSSRQHVPSPHRPP